MSYVNLARPVAPNGPAPGRTSENRCGMAPHRGDVTTVWAAASIRLQETKRAEDVQSQALSHRPAGTAVIPFRLLKVGQA